MKRNQADENGKRDAWQDEEAGRKERIQKTPNSLFSHEQTPDAVICQLKNGLSFNKISSAGLLECGNFSFFISKVVGIKIIHVLFSSVSLLTHNPQADL